MNKKKNKFNLIYFLMDDEFRQEIESFNKTDQNFTKTVFSKKFNTTKFKTKIYDKVSTPFINTNLFNEDN
ncbi:hypothetical protein A0O34_05930 [Chryseobacterium glaciei]|uniref:Uncharacterized protein n=1 Tax=Chryseobacterium glaciei TaxID=1685010 RepID=A0A172XT33_9FLAO|nr:hypothetical protein [Chryseobacterium glaciei]ANF50076.1 hypothetical protein A0O34_05930 [Chryseobacterium glaciei]